MPTIKSYTDIEQSKKLAETLPLESADMVHFGIHLAMDGKYYLSGTNTEDDIVPIYKNLCTKVFVKVTASDITCQLPCWSLAALFNVLPKNLNIGRPLLNSNYKGYYWVQYYDEYMNPFDFKTICFDNPIDACYDMMLKLHERKML